MFKFFILYAFIISTQVICGIGMILSSTRKCIRPQNRLLFKSTYIQQYRSSEIKMSQSNADDKFSTNTLRRKIFCNIELNGASLEAVGFDMDFTLAQYKEAFDLLAFEGAKLKLVDILGYPANYVSKFSYCNQEFRRGLIIDKKRGNILKVDCHKYVRKAYHGISKEISSVERKALYSTQVTSFSESIYVNIDTLFHPVDAVLFCNLVELKDNNPGLINKSYEEIYKDIRHCVDLCHRDGVIKDIVMKDPSSYIIYDENIVPLLKSLRNAGKKTFLLTNSMWEYTDVVMNFLFFSQNENKDITDWKNLFDVVIVGACKPAFLTDNYLSLFKVIENNKNGAIGHVANIDDSNRVNAKYVEQHGKVYQGGNWIDLHRILDINSGDRILYVGDHMYADILRSKRTLGWRTCLIIPELEHEVEIASKETTLFDEVFNWRRWQYDLDEYIDELKQRENNGENVKKELQDVEIKAAEVKLKVREVTDLYNSKFHQRWGQLFKAGHQDSRFAKQVMDYACLYTSRASNLAFIFPNRSFRPAQDFMPHDQFLADSVKPLKLLQEKTGL